MLICREESQGLTRDIEEGHHPQLVRSLLAHRRNVIAIATISVFFGPATALGSELDNFLMDAQRAVGRGAEALKSKSNSSSPKSSTGDEERQHNQSSVANIGGKSGSCVYHSGPRTLSHSDDEEVTNLRDLWSVLTTLAQLGYTDAPKASIHRKARNCEDPLSAKDHAGVRAFQSDQGLAVDGRVTYGLSRKARAARQEQLMEREKAHKAELDKQKAGGQKKRCDPRFEGIAGGPCKQ